MPPPPLRATELRSRGAGHLAGSIERRSPESSTAPSRRQSRGTTHQQRPHRNGSRQVGPVADASVDRREGPGSPRRSHLRYADAHCEQTNRRCTTVQHKEACLMGIAGAFRLQMRTERQFDQRARDGQSLGRRLPRRGLPRCLRSGSVSALLACRRVGPSPPARTSVVAACGARAIRRWAARLGEASPHKVRRWPGHGRKCSMSTASFQLTRPRGGCARRREHRRAGVQSAEP